MPAPSDHFPSSGTFLLLIPPAEDEDVCEAEVYDTRLPELIINTGKKSLPVPSTFLNRTRRKNTSSRRWPALLCVCLIFFLCCLVQLWTTDVVGEWSRVSHLWTALLAGATHSLRFLQLSPSRADRHQPPLTASNGSPNATRQLPQAIIIGVKKGGTRALLEYIRMHPSVRAPGSEMHFFDRHYERGIDWYRNQMPLTKSSQLTVEKTPSYFVTRDVPSRVFQMNSKTKLIIVVRDPITRAISDYTQALSKGRSTRSFHEMAFYSNGTHRLLDTSWGALRIGLYAQHLEKWLKYFPLEQLLFISGEELIQNPAAEMDRVQDFLGLERLVRARHFYFDRAKGFPCLRRPEMQLRKCLGKSKGRQHPRIAADVIAQLRDFYKPFNQKFYGMVGQDFGWL